MLTTEEKLEIQKAAAAYPQASGAAIDALKTVQARRGWVSDEALAAVAAELGMSTTELDGVATFYNLIFRRPVGRHVILICNSVSCWIMGYHPLREHLQRRLGVELGGTTADGQFTLLPTVCLGACDRAPAMMIDGELFGPLDAEGADKVLARFASEPGQGPTR